jgi:hypothetical protein
VTTDTKVRQGRDGRFYPARALTTQERGRARVLAHRLVHDRRLSIRVAQMVLAESYGLRRSVGSIAADLADYECATCAEPEYPNT